MKHPLPQSCVLDRPMKHRQRGVTLVELMISVVIGLVIVAAASTVYLYSKQAFNSSTETSQLEENGQFALNLLSRYIQSAGFVMVDKKDPTTVALSNKMRGCEFGFNNSTAPTTSTLLADMGCLAATPAGQLPTESIVLFSETDPYNVASGRFQGFDCVGNSSVAFLPTSPTGLTRNLTRSHFYVSNTVVQTPGGPITMGQLSCLADSTSAAGVVGFTQQPLVPGIQQIAFNYLMPYSAAEPDTAKVAMSATALNITVPTPAVPNIWDTVLAIEVCVLAKSSQPAGNDTGTAYTDCYGNPPVGAVAGEIYRTFRTTVRLRNKSLS